MCKITELSVEMVIEQQTANNDAKEKQSKFCRDITNQFILALKQHSQPFKVSINTSKPVKNSEDQETEAK